MQLSSVQHQMRIPEISKLMSMFINLLDPEEFTLTNWRTWVEVPNT